MSTAGTDSIESLFTKHTSHFSQLGRIRENSEKRQKRVKQIIDQINKLPAGHIKNYQLCSHVEYKVLKDFVNENNIVHEYIYKNMTVVSHIPRYNCYIRIYKGFSPCHDPILKPKYVYNRRNDDELFVNSWLQP